MREATDIASIASVIKQDLDDTNSKLWNLCKWLQIFQNFSDLIKQYDGKSMDLQEFKDLVFEYYDPDYTDDDLNTGLVLVANPIINFKRGQAKTDEVSSASLRLGLAMTAVDSSMKTLELEAYYNGGKFKSNATVDNQPIDIQSFNFDEFSLDNYSVCSRINQIKESIQTNEFLLDMVNVLKIPSSFPVVINKWLNTSNISTQVKNAISSAISSIDGSAQSILLWIQRIYEEMSNTNYQDEELQFSSTDYVVKTAFVSVGKAVISAIGTVVSIILLAVGKVAGLIAFAITSIASAIFQAFENRSNPLITLKQNNSLYNDFLPIPILQEDVGYNSNFSLGDGDCIEAWNVRLNCFLANFRIFKNKGLSESTYYEAFLRCPVGPHTLCYYCYDWINRSAPWNKSGFEGMDEFFNDFKNEEDTNAFNLADLPYEINQGRLITLHLFLFYMCFGSNVTMSSDSGVDCYNAIKNGTATEAQLKKFFYVEAQWAHDVYSNDDVDKAFYTNQAIVGTSLTWNFVINKLIPVIRQYCKISNTQYSDISTSLDYIRARDFINANDTIWTGSPFISYYSTWVEDALQQTDSPFIIPKYTSDGFIANLVCAVVIIAATVAVTVAATIAIKRFTARVATSKVANLSQLKQFNDAVQQDPSYSVADKKAAFNDYYKAVRSYNRFSWLWGGGTWSATNGWIDYGVTNTATASLADSMKSQMSDQIMSFNPFNQQYNGTAAINSENLLPLILRAISGI